MRELLVLLAIGIGTYAMRAVFLVTARFTPTSAVTLLLPHVGPAVLAAITLPMLLAPRGTYAAADSLPALGAAAVAWVLWRRTARLPVALFGGLCAWWLSLAALGAL